VRFGAGPGKVQRRRATRPTSTKIFYRHSNKLLIYGTPTLRDIGGEHPLKNRSGDE